MRDSVVVEIKIAVVLRIEDFSLHQKVFASHTVQQHFQVHFYFLRPTRPNNIFKSLCFLFSRGKKLFFFQKLSTDLYTINYSKIMI